MVLIAFVYVINWRILVQLAYIPKMMISLREVFGVRVSCYQIGNRPFLKAVAIIVGCEFRVNGFGAWFDRFIKREF